MSSLKTLEDLGDLSGKRVLLRADFNVPLKDGQVSDATRLERTKDTVARLTAAGAKVVILSHLGRPKGARVTEMSLVLENLRYHAGEEANDPAFAAALASLGDAFVSDAFSTAHRAHASTEGLAKLLPSAAGLLMQEEIEHLSKALEQPERPLAAIVGGSKVSTKLDLLGNLVRKVDCLVIGGGMANTFLHARGVAVGASLCEKDLADTARQIEAAPLAAGCSIVLPVDAVVAPAIDAGDKAETVALDAVPDDRMILDVGPASIAAVNAQLAAAKTLVWNGPLGAFEFPPFDRATNAVAQEAARLTAAGSLLTVAGGGDTVSALIHAGVAEQVSYLSTAGGAFLEWLEGKELPGVAVLMG